MRYIFLILTSVLLLTTGSNDVKAQQLPMYSQYMHNKLVLNPAVAGTKSYRVARFSYRKQWMSFDGAPSTQTLSYHQPLKKRTTSEGGKGEEGSSIQNMGIGGYLYNDALGPIRKTGLNIDYSYHLHLSSSTVLSLGLEGGIFQYALKGSELKTQDDGDKAIATEKSTLFAPDAAFGAYLYGDKYFVSLSAPQLIPVDINFTDKERTEVGRLHPHFFLYGGYTFNINENFDIEPSLLVKTVKSTPYQTDINVKGYYKEQYWLGLSYRNSIGPKYQVNDLVVSIGAQVNKKYHIGYSYDISIGEIGRYNNGSHEITLGYNFRQDGETASAAPRL